MPPTTRTRLSLRARAGAVLACLALGAAPAPFPSALAPRGHLAFRSYAAAQGLLNLSLWQLLQDRQGFIWAGTDDGLYRFDGFRFDGFGLPEGLPSSRVEVLHEDREGTLWVGTAAGLVRWSGTGFEAGARDLPPGPVAALADGPSGLWAATAQGPSARDAQGRFSAVPGWAWGQATALCGGRGGRVWVAAWEGRARILAWRDGAWKALEAPAELASERIDGLVEDGQGRLWARAPRSLWVLEPGAAALRRAEPPIPLSGDRGYLSAGGHGDVWVPTDQGIAHFDGGTWSTLGAKDGLPTSWSRTVLEDREGSVWIGSLGLHRMLGRGAWRAWTRQEGLPSEIVWCMLRDRERRLWVGTDKGLARLDGPVPRVLPGTERHTVRTLAEGADGTLYFGGVPPGEVTAAPPGGGPLRHLAFEGGVVPSRIMRLLVDRDGVLWAATEGEGLFRAAPGEGRLARVALPGAGPRDSVRDLQLDPQGRIWAAGDKGLHLLEGGRWRRFGREDGLQDERLSFVRPLKDGGLLVAYFEPLGVARCRWEGGRLAVARSFHYGRADRPGKVYLLGEDARNRLWVGGSQGLDLLLPEGTEHFGTAEGLAGDDCDNAAFLAEPDGDVWVGTSTGLAHFEARAFPGLQAPPRTALVSVGLGGRMLAPEGPKPEVPHRSGTLEVRFASLTFLREGALQYRMRLKGLEEDWHTTAIPEARFPTLRKGQYRFEVSARLGEGAWGPVEAFEFRVLPAWWQTWWMRCLMGLAGLGALAWLGRWRTAALKRHNAELESEVMARTQALMEANRALLNQSFMDPLTGLANRRFLMVGMDEDVAAVRRAYRRAEVEGSAKPPENGDIVFMMVDLDHFKTVNDDHGHASGDLVLQQIAGILKAATRETDTVVRWGGEEFLVVARRSSRQDADILAERIRAEVALHPFDVGNGHAIRRTCSIGFAVFPFVPGAVDAFSWEQVVDLADHCLYMAKHGGRDAWLGIFPTEGGDPTPLLAGYPFDIPSLVERGVLTIRTSMATVPL